MWRDSKRLQRPTHARCITGLYKGPRHAEREPQRAFGELSEAGVEQGLSLTHRVINPLGCGVRQNSEGSLEQGGIGRGEPVIDSVPLPPVVSTHAGCRPTLVILVPYGESRTRTFFFSVEAAEEAKQMPPGSSLCLHREVDLLIGCMHSRLFFRCSCQDLGNSPV